MSDADLPRLDLLYGPHLKFFPEEVGQLRFYLKFFLNTLSFLFQSFLCFLILLMVLGLDRIM